VTPISAIVIEDSVSEAGKRITTMQLRYPRFVHAEFMTHRMFSRNASSSRAIPVAKMIEQVRTDPAMPVHWGANEPGMQAHAELTGTKYDLAVDLWRNAATAAADVAMMMEKIGLHKQVANRILEPFQFIHVVVTSTEWDNFFALRDHADAQPEIRALARAMSYALNRFEPTVRDSTRRRASGWHLPYIMPAEREAYAEDPLSLLQFSAARCARVSYKTHGDMAPDQDKDRALFTRLVGSAPLHASPIEHQAAPAETSWEISRNFRGWYQYRAMYEAGYGQ
jgi:thymidylate synthase ThyX